MTKLHPKGVVAVAGALTAVALVLTTQTTTAISFEELLPSGVESIRTSDEIRQNFGGQDLIMVLVRGDATDPKVLETMVWLEQHVRLDNRNVKGERVYITRAYSVADMVLMASAGAIPRTSQEVAAILENLRHQTPHVDRLVTSDNNKTIALFHCDARSDAELKLTADIVRDWIGQLPDNRAEFVATGTPVVAADLLSKIPQDALNTTMMALALCAVVLCIVFKSIGMGLIAMVPMGLALTWQFGTFYLLDVPLNVITVLISALLVGIGIDFSIHTTHRYLEGVRDRQLKPEGAVHATVLHVGRALLAAAATTCGAFGLLALSRVPIMRPSAA
ncbi:MAG: MMPL family transporter [Candidatus Hodarchaeaceae archaeon]|nr:MMPL family transporter [Candidatus Hodarchaeaceae archaeon]